MHQAVISTCLLILVMIARADNRGVPIERLLSPVKPKASMEAAPVYFDAPLRAAPRTFWR